MNNEYVIVNKTVLEKRIKESEEEYKSEPAYQFNTSGDKLIIEIMILKQILSQSTPLIPEIEKAFDEGKSAHITSKYIHDTPSFEDQKQDYISNLKLDV